LIIFKSSEQRDSTGAISGQTFDNKLQISRMYHEFHSSIMSEKVILRITKH